MSYFIIHHRYPNLFKIIGGGCSSSGFTSLRTGYEKIIEDKSLNYLYRSFTVETFGAFGTEAWQLIRQVCGRDHPHAHDDCCMWRRPDPKKDFVLSIAFAIQRGNANTLLRANSRRRDRQAAAVVDPETFQNSNTDA